MTTPTLHDQRGAELTVDSPNEAVTGPDTKIQHFEITPLSKRRLMRGLDEIEHTQEYRALISRFEEDQKSPSLGFLHNLPAANERRRSVFATCHFSMLICLPRGDATFKSCRSRPDSETKRVWASPRSQPGRTLHARRLSGS
jgi:hypothetical protein